MKTPAELGGLVRAARLHRGWTQQQAADAAGVSRRFINLLEGGEHGNAELWRVLALLDALDVELVGTLPPAASHQADRAVASEPDVPDGFDLDAHLSGFRSSGESS